MSASTRRRSWRVRRYGPPARDADATRLVYFTPNDVLVPRVDRQCIMRFCEAMAKTSVDVEVVSLDVRLDYAEPTQDRDLWDVYGLSTPFRVAILPCWARQGGSGNHLLSAWRALVYSLYASTLLLSGRKRGTDQVTALYFKNYLFGFPFALLRRLSRTQVLLLFEIHTPPHHRLAKRVINHVDGLIPVSFILERELKSDYHVEEARILVAHQGVDLEFVEQRWLGMQAARSEVGLPLDKKLVVYTGKVHSEYGEIDLLLDAARLLDPNVVLVLVGGRQEQVEILRERLRRERRENVILAGFIAPSDVFTYQMAADVLVTYYPRDIPLNKYRASPGKLFEYMASKRPIVTADLPALREALGADSAMFVVPDSPPHLVAAIEAVLADPTLSERLAKNAYADVKRFTWDGRAERVNSFIDRLASTRGAHS
jgi:glycosyltransferase involved in cell wall biosynthesis